MQHWNVTDKIARIELSWLEDVDSTPVILSVIFYSAFSTLDLFRPSSSCQGRINHGAKRAMAQGPPP